MADKSSKKVPYGGTAWQSAKVYGKYFFWGPFFKMFEAIFELITPFLIARIVTDGIIYDAQANPVGADWTRIGIYTAIILAMAVFGFSSTIVCQYLASKASQGTGTDLRNRLFAHTQTLAPADIERFGIGNAINVITNDTNTFQQGVAMLIRLAVRAPFLVLGALICSFIIDWKAGLLFLALALFLFAFLMLVLPRTSKGYVKVQSRLDELSQKTNDSLAGARVVKAFDRESLEVRKFEADSTAYRDDSMRIATITSLLGPVTTFLVNLAMIMLILFSSLGLGFQTSGDAATLSQQNGNIIALVNYLNQILQAVLVVTNLIIIFTRFISANARINSLLAVEPSLKDAPKIPPTAIVTGDPLFELNRAVLAYPGSSLPALADMTLTIHKGDRIGIIGGTGSGKSSFLYLLLRFYDRTRGAVDYKGHDIEDYSLQALYREIGYVPQRPAVFRGTIRSNLLMANPSASEADMRDALRLALCDYFLADPQGLDRPIDEDAKDLSGGQRQRLAIAMALVKKPETLILDDSYSALDFVSERKLRNNLLGLGSDLTQIIVSERISSLMGSDWILVLKSGKAEAFGKPADMYRISPTFKEIWDVQKGIAK